MCEKDTPPEKKTLGKIGLQNTKSGAGEQLSPLGCRAKARVKEVCFLGRSLVITCNVRREVKPFNVDLTQV